MIPIALCEKLLQLAGGEQLPASKPKHAIIDELLSEGIVSQKITGRTKRLLYIPDVAALDAWIYNKYAIHDLGDYVHGLKDEMATRASLVQVSNDSKAKRVRTYKGFLVNSYLPIECSLNGQSYVVNPAAGTFQFIYDFAHFLPSPHVVIVGVENMENFRFVERLAQLLMGVNPLFVCRYPQEQSKDLMRWLLSIPNPYIHFGDYDLAGINIYLREYKTHLHERASFFVPADIEELLQRYGNPKLYDQQQLGQEQITDDNVVKLVGLLHRYKKGLEQEVYL